MISTIMASAMKSRLHVPLSPQNPYPHGTVFGQNYYGDIVFYEMGTWGLVEMDPYDAWGYGYGDGYRTGAYGDYGRYGRYDPFNPYYDYDPNDWDGYRGPRNADVVLYRDAGYRGSALWPESGCMEPFHSAFQR
jgi:hypothetical protein